MREIKEGIRGVLIDQGSQAIRVGTDAVSVFAGGNERMRMKSDGNVGIGTTNPNTTLDVRGFTGYGTAGNIATFSSNISMSNKDVKLDIFINNNDATGGNANGSYAGLQSSMNFVAYTPLILNPNGGNVGIGTATIYSETKLSVWGRTSSAPSAGVPVSFFNTFPTAYGGTFGFYSVGHGTLYYDGTNWLIPSDGANAGGSAIVNGWSGNTHFVNARINNSGGAAISDANISPYIRMTITGDGNVGIGTIYPSAKLEIAVPAGDSWPVGIRILQPNISASPAYNYGPCIQLGKSATCYNNASISYLHVSDGNRSNYIGMGIACMSGNSLIVNGYGKVGVGTTAPIDATLDVRSFGNGVSIASWVAAAFGASPNAGKRIVMGTFENRAIIGGHRCNENGTFLEWDGVYIQGRNTEFVQRTPLVLMNTESSTRFWEVGPNFGGDFVIMTDNKGPYLSQGTPTYWNYQSDIRLKEQIEPIQNTLATILSLNPVSYKWKSNPDSIHKSLGLIAQEVKEILPGIVNSLADPEHGEIYGVQYESIIPVLIGSIKEQHQIITSLSDRLARLESLLSI